MDWRRRFMPILATLVLVALIALPLFAQGRRGKGMPKYDPKAEITIQGTVEEVTQHTGVRGWKGTHLALKSGAETFDVHLGPSEFLADRGVTFEKGDRIEVIGSKVKYGGSDALIAREVKKADQMLVLRDAQGIPKWSRSRWRWR
jgi:hypothetical protein